MLQHLKPLIFYLSGTNGKITGFRCPNTKAHLGNIFNSLTVPGALHTHSLTMQLSFQLDTELNDLKIMICLRSSEVTVDRNSVCNVTEKLMEHGIHCLPCSYTNDIIDLLP